MKRFEQFITHFFLVTNVLFFAQKVICIPPSFFQPYKADIIIFSEDNPQQLSTLLDSIDKNISNINQKIVIYQASTKKHKKEYKQIFTKFPYTHTFKQNKQKKYKDLTLKALNYSYAPYVMLATDTTVITDSIDLYNCCHWLEQTGAYGCYLDMNKQKKENHTIVYNDVCKWNFTNEENTKSTVHTFDMTLYRKSDITPLCKKLNFTNTSTFAKKLAKKKPRVNFGIFFADAKVTTSTTEIVICNEETELQEKSDIKNTNIASVSRVPELTTATQHG